MNTAESKKYWAAAFERTAAVRKGEFPDRVPCSITCDESLASRITGLTARVLLSNAKLLAEKSVECAEFLGGDNLGLATPFYGGPMEIDAVARVNGKADAIVCHDYASRFIKQGIIAATEDDINNLIIPNHRKDGMWPILFDAACILRERYNYMPVVSLGITWQNVQQLRGSKCFQDIRRNPDLLLKLCEKIYESQIDLMDTYIEKLGKPALLRNTQYAFNSMMLSFEDAWKFEGQFAARACKKYGLPLQVHNCGFEPYWEQMIDRFAEEGIKVIAIETTRPKDINYWVKFRERYPDITIIGANIYVNDELLLGTPQDVELKVKENIQALGPKSYFIASPQCIVGWGMSLKNIQAFRTACEKYGKYPINLSL
ncbi:uroporphyrinogen decarboxylase family protein [Candidatus Formimonas warabiya]|uniref:Uroporphyrinogen decarboxylase (URO-D) domain-containing protein n=1 Tax=Formimonas warabiya TaxID=1761012 RepID=A0A3G1L093_FORW1|nr:uroporphyrinogen decarboxylase family protein [Candidatus Formimonas warabiya]ATW28059.1 hypothetical protein DCMF_27860 [Candidatus Formimonas warabiya]